MTDHSQYIKEEFGCLVGKTVIEVRQLREEELDNMCWDDSYGSPAFVVWFDDGTHFIPSMDPEGNGPGHLFIGNAS